MKNREKKELQICGKKKEGIVKKTENDNKRARKRKGGKRELRMTIIIFKQIFLRLFM